MGGLDPIPAIPLGVALAGLFFYVLYVVVRAAVYDGIKQAYRAPATRWSKERSE